MKHTKKYLNNSTDKQYYEKQISNLSDNQKEEFEDLVIKLENAGAKNPLSWANSEVNEKIPQLGRFLVMKSLLKIAKSIDTNISLAEDFDSNFRNKFEAIKDKIGQEQLFDFLNSFSKGMIGNVIDILDNGNEDVGRDKMSWVLMKTDENFELTGQIIQGLHEDFLEFENEIK